MTGVSKLIGVLAAPTILGWSAVIAQADSVGGTSSGIAISGVAAGAASAALAYMARQLASGNLVHRSTADTEKTLSSTVEKLAELIADNRRREDVHIKMLMDRANVANAGAFPAINPQDAS